ncbi:MAG: porin family protein [Acidobacteria bacterium]|nr:MAG: porin family protein [Acidobacteriota bacterium]
MLNRVLIWTILVISLSSSMAFAQSWYAGGFAGWNNTDDTDFLTGVGRIDTSFEGGTIFGFSGGYRLDNGVRLEGEVSWRDADVDKHRLDGTGLDGSKGAAKSRSFMANALYDFNRDGKVRPYIGAGLGWTKIDYDRFGVDAVPNVLNDDNGVWAYQGLAGLSIGIGERWEVFGEYRYFKAQDPEVKTSAETGSVTTDIGYQSQDFLLGLRLSF